MSLVMLFFSIQWANLVREYTLTLCISRSPDHMLFYSQNVMLSLDTDLVECKLQCQCTLYISICMCFRADLLIGVMDDRKPEEACFKVILIM